MPPTESNDKTAEPPENEAVREFLRRLWQEWLPCYCQAPDRNHSGEGFKPASIVVTPEDASNCLRALDHGVVQDLGGGRYRAPLSQTDDFFFSEGRRAIVPRPITFLRESVITFAAAGRLYLDYGWPKALVGVQGQDWAFDVFTSLSPSTDSPTEYIAGEVKKSATELQALIDLMRTFAQTDLVDVDSLTKEQMNAYKKVQRLRHIHAPLFWAIGPGNISLLFDVAYALSGEITFTEADLSRLAYSPSR